MKIKFIPIIGCLVKVNCESRVALLFRTRSIIRASFRGTDVCFAQLVSDIFTKLKLKQTYISINYELKCNSNQLKTMNQTIVNSYITGISRLSLNLFLGGGGNRAPCAATKSGSVIKGVNQVLIEKKGYKYHWIWCRAYPGP